MTFDSACTYCPWYLPAVPLGLLPRSSFMILVLTHTHTLVSCLSGSMPLICTCFRRCCSATLCSQLEQYPSLEARQQPQRTALRLYYQPAIIYSKYKLLFYNNGNSIETHFLKTTKNSVIRNLNRKSIAKSSVSSRKLVSVATRYNIT